MSQMHLTKAERRQVEAVEAQLKPWGPSYTLERTQHLVAVIAGPKGGHWRLVLACTPRNADAAIDMARQKTRRIIRDINTRLGL